MARRMGFGLFFLVFLKVFGGIQYNILLIHQPVGFPQAATAGINLQLSGHTHRGQFFPFNLLAPLFYRYHYGLYSLGSAHIYTSAGTGLSSDSEIVLLEISTG